VEPGVHPRRHSALSLPTIGHSMRLAVDPGDLPFMDDGLEYGLKGMPVSW
jgi:hypothetical protein